MTQAIKLLFVFLYIIGFGLLISPVQAQTISQQVSITYPIPELENCRDAKECYFYCEIPRHQTTCQNFSATHRLPQVLGISKQESSLTYPIEKLGNCADKTACKTYCQQYQHQTACQDFAKTQGLNSPLQKLLDKAREVLGCSSLQSCQQLCNQSHQNTSCTNFAKNYSHLFKT